jgi:hypothetical protein
MAYTATNWVEGVTTLGPTNMNKIETELVYLDTRIPPAALGYGTALPGSPVDGQEYVLVDSTTNPSYQWRFRYNAGSSSAYKWEYVGGAPAYSEINTSEGTTSLTYAALTTIGPSVTLPRAGDYDVTLGTRLFASATGVTVYMSYDIGATAAADADAVTLYATSVSGVSNSAAVSRLRRKPGLTAVSLTAKYRVDAASTGTFSARWLAAIPVRVS